MSENRPFQAPGYLIFLFAIGLAVGGTGGLMFAIATAFGGLIIHNVDWSNLALLLEESVDKGRAYLSTPITQRLEEENTPMQQRPIIVSEQAEIIEANFTSQGVRLAKPTDKVHIWIADVERDMP